MKVHILRYETPAAVWAGAIAMLLAASGCQRDVRLAGRKLRDVEVKTVEYYGITLDQQASPKDVAYVLLRAMREDFQAKDTAARDAALDIQFDICAADEIVSAARSSLTRREVLYRLVHRWTPTIAYYLDSFPTTREQTNSRLEQTRIRPAKFSSAEANMCEVLLRVTGPQDAHAVVTITLLQDHNLWRVFQVGCVPTGPEIKSAPPKSTATG